MAICKTCKSHFDQLHLNSSTSYLEYSKTGECQECQDKRKILKLTCDTCGKEMAKEEYALNNGFCQECVNDRAE